MDGWQVTTSLQMFKVYKEDHINIEKKFGANFLLFNLNKHVFFVRLLFKTQN